MKTREKVIIWAKERNLTDYERQALKLGEEIGELLSSILKKDRALEEDSFGDIEVVLTILCDQLQVSFPKGKQKIQKKSENQLCLMLLTDLGDIASRVEYPFRINTELDYFYSTLKALADVRGFNLESCLDKAYEVIKNRTGKTIDGSFVKDSE